MAPNRLTVASAVIGASFLLVACDATATSPSAPTASETPVESPASSSQCHSVNGLPDHACTPGAIDSASVTQSTIASTICLSGYTSTGLRADGRAVRPPVDYTDGLKLTGIVAYGYADRNPADYEEDHLIPLELGGDGYSTKNLWPEPRYGQHPASEKGSVENQLHALVCDGALSLSAAQTAIATNWETAARVSASPLPSPSLSPTTSPAASALTVTITTSTYGSIAATTLPGASCTARAKLPSGRISTAAGLQATVVAGNDGVVSWSYGTVSTTTKGTGTHTVTCTLNGSTVSASAAFTVS
jgi:hypothetical protein